MGFCRRCGDIVVGERCKCGGTAVAPVVQWNAASSGEEKQDLWSKTYTRDKPREQSPVRAATSVTSPKPTESGVTASVKRFPRPRNHTIANPVSDRISAHITSTTTSRPATLVREPSQPDGAAGILPSPHTSELSKAYGSVLQPKESLESFRCHICATPFPPDATIYPNPSSHSLSADADGFLCRPCFVANGGSKGDCYSCRRPVLILKREGGFVETGERVYHKACFACEGCLRNIGDAPMVDLLGRPSCTDCFDSCLARKDAPRQRTPSVPDHPLSNLGGVFAGRNGSRSREGSPALEELEQRLGITKKRDDGSAVPFPVTPRSSVDALSSTGSRVSLEDSPRPRMYNRAKSLEPGAAGPARSITGSPATVKPSQDAVEEMKRRFMRISLTSQASPATATPDTSPSKIPSPSRTFMTPELKTRRSITTLRNTPQNTNGSLQGLDQTTTPTKTPAPARTYTTPELKTRRSITSLQSTSNTGSSQVQEPTPERRPFLVPRRSFDMRSQTSASSVSGESDRTSQTPDLLSDWSDATTQSSGVTTPPKMTSSGARKLRGQSIGVFPSQITKQAHSTHAPGPAPQKIFHSKRSLENLRIPAPLSPESKCARCAIPLFTTNGGKFVTVPEEPTSTGVPPKVYHADCFRCHVCDGMFAAADNGRAVFVRTDVGPCHVDCVPPERVRARPISTPPVKFNPFPSTSSVTSFSSSSSSSVSSGWQRPPPSAPAATSSPFPGFATPGRCPGCFKAVSPMERGVVQGPQGTRWHSTCLVCGGQEAKRRSIRRGDGVPGCGKKLDSAAKVGGEGGVWCRDCLLLLASRASPIKTLAPQPTGTGPSFWSTRNDAPQVSRQFTGATTIVRQQTGLGQVTSPLNDPELLRQLNGGGLSPTHQLGMAGLAKQFTGMDTVRSHMTGVSVISTHVTGNGTDGGIMRPKSAAAGRSSKSVDEGRGMFIMRQMTGGAGTFSPPM